MKKNNSSWLSGGVVPVVALGFMLGGLWPSTAPAEGFRNPPAGAAALGRVGGKIALADDAAAIEHNPANLVHLTNSQVQVGLTLIHAEAEFTSGLSGLTDRTEDPWKLLPSVFASTPLNDKTALGLGITTPFGQSTVWSQTSQLSAPYFAELQVININPTLAAKLTDTISLGVGADLYVSDIDLRQKLSPLSVVKLQGSGAGLGCNAALAWQVAERQRLALTYRSPVKVKYDGHCTVDNIPAALPRTDFDTEITFPAMVALGYSLQATDKLKLEADVEWIQFSSFDNLTLDAHQDNPLLHPQGDPTPPTSPLTAPQDWKDSWTFGAGVEYQVSPCLALRAGYIYIQSPIRDETLAPTLPDDNRHAVSVGLGFQHARHAVDLAFLHSFFHDRDIRTNPVPPYNGAYAIASEIMTASYTFTY
ncbi:MAG: outer membrane protein transport protein [Kiritimatiellaeota bacterium]|nr:outer membrane protein transport protein [Kiritimatiellota bacterium]